MEAPPIFLSEESEPWLTTQWQTRNSTRVTASHGSRSGVLCLCLGAASPGLGGRTDGQKGSQAGGQKGGRGRADGKTDERKNGQANGQANGQKGIFSLISNGNVYRCSSMFIDVL